MTSGLTTDNARGAPEGFSVAGDPATGTDDVCQRSGGIFSGWGHNHCNRVIVFISSQTGAPVAARRIFARVSKKITYIQCNA